MPRTPPSTQRKHDTELLTKGVICALIGLVILIGPYVARGEGVRELLQQASLVGWFALVLGLAFLVRYGLNRRREEHRR